MEISEIFSLCLFNPRCTREAAACETITGKAGYF
jgi:hypothetical protein